MLKRFFSLLLPLSTLLPAAEFKVEGNSFVLEGKAFQIRSGEMHYSRVARGEWRKLVRPPHPSRRGGLPVRINTSNSPR